MVEKIGHIKNPLTVIAIFAGIAEISGTVVLPFLEAQIQSTYVWFLMGFPFFLVGVFFYTLHKKPTALYSPSDYQDENNFVTAVRNATPAELSFKIRQEAKEIQADIEQQRPTTPVEDASQAESSSSGPDEATPPAPPKATAEDVNATQLPRASQTDYVLDAWPLKANSSVHHRVLGDLALAEKLAISRVSKSLNLAFQPNIMVMLPNGAGVTFDAFAFGPEIAHAVEVKFFATPTIDLSRLYEAVQAAKTAGDALSQKGIKTLLLHLFIVTESKGFVLERAKIKIVEYASGHGVFIKVHTATMTELANEYQIGPEPSVTPP